MMGSPTAAVPSRAERPLDWLNFFLADVRDGLGPYLAIFLLTRQHWDEATIGVVLTIGGIAGLLAQAPAGAFIDATRFKRGVIVVAAILVTVCSLAMPFVSSFAVMAALQVAVAGVGSLFQPAIAALTLGLVGPKAFSRRTGRNEAWNHAGNAVAALLAGAAAYAFGTEAVFWLMAAMALASVAATLAVPAHAVDHDLARGLTEDGDTDGTVSGFAIVLASRPLLVFAVCAALFHFANAPMLTMVSQKLALQNRDLATTLTSGCIIAAQLVMIPAAMIVGWHADVWGRKPLFLAGFVVLALRGFLYPLSDDAAWLLAVQALDGVGAGLFGALFPLIVNDITRGTGRFNLSMGALGALFGVGASLSTTVAGFVVVHEGYGAGFILFGAVAAIGAGVFWLFMPETNPVGEARGGAPAAVPAAAALS